MCVLCYATAKSQPPMNELLNKYSEDIYIASRLHTVLYYCNRPVAKSKQIKMTATAVSETSCLTDGVLSWG